MNISPSFNRIAFGSGQGQKAPAPRPVQPGVPQGGKPAPGKPAGESAPLPVPDRDPGACKAADPVSPTEPLRTCFA